MMLTFLNLLPTLACLAPVLLLGSADHRHVAGAATPLDLTHLDTAPRLAAFYDDPPAVPGCPTCGAETPPLDSSVELVVPGPTLPSNFFITFKMVGDATPGECATDGTEPVCIDKKCKYDISFKIEGHEPSSWQLLINTFPPSNPKDPTSFILPTSQFVGGWQDIEHFCGGSTDYEIEYQWYSYPDATHYMDEDVVYTFGCKDC